MNSDATPPRPEQAGATPFPARPSNLKSRWRRAPHHGPPKPAGATPPGAVGAVADLASARESLSGRHARGYEAPETAAEASTPVAPPPAPLVPEILPELPPAPTAMEPTAPPARAPRGERETPPRPPARGEPDGEQPRYIALLPDPANDPAPRRLRTEAAVAPPPAEEYSPSRAPRRPDKTIPLKTSRGSGRDRPEAADSSRAHATIPARLSSSRHVPAGAAPAKTGGFLSRLKHFFGFGSPADGQLPAMMPHHPDKDREGAHAASPRSGSEGAEGGRHRRRRRRGGRGRHSAGHASPPRQHDD